MVKGRNSNTVSLVGKEYYGDALQSTRYYELSKDISTMRFGDRGHWGYPNFPEFQDIGGAFYLEGVRTTRQAVGVGTIWRGGELKQNYRGSLVVDIPHTGAWGGTFLPDAWGSQAYAKLKPTKPVMNSLNSIYELKDLPSMLRERFFRNGFTSGAAKAFVSYQFGWKQLLQDVRALFFLQQKAEKRLAWLLSREGKPTKQSIQLFETDAIVEDYPINGYGLLQPILVTQYYRYEPRGRRLTHNRERVWAEGQFRWWLPPGPRDVVWSRKMKAALFGLNPTPSVVYKAVPWTWLIDWFTGIGTMLQNMESGVADRLSADYWYIMRQKDWTIQNNVSGWFVDPSGNPIEVHGSSSSSAFVKTRTKGDPFGFGTEQINLSSMQLAILGAIGLSKVR